MPIAVEYDGPPVYLAPYCTVAPPDSFVDVCAETGRRKDLPAVSAASLERFAKELPMQSIMQRLIKESIG